MLKYKYNINVSSNEEKIKISDAYVSPDLALMSGYTEHNNLSSPQSTLWVRSKYSIGDQQTTLAQRDVVKRNGYILVPLDLPVNWTKVFVYEDGETGGEYYSMPYVEYRGNTYYATVDDEKEFIINGEAYALSGSFITIMDKIYVEDNRVVVGDITYNVYINNNGDPSITDFTGEPYINDLWVTSGVTADSEFFEKIFIDGGEEKIVECRSVTYYGHMAYIEYNGEKYYIEYFKDESGNTVGAGVVIDGVRYECSGPHPGFDYDGRVYGGNIYDIRDYMSDMEKAVVYVDGYEYAVEFEPSQIQSSGIIGIETVLNDLSILLNDIITIRSKNISTEALVYYDDDNEPYVFLNGKKYISENHVCDSIELSGKEFILTYEDGATEPGTDVIASINVDDKTKMYFKTILNGDEYYAERVQYVNNEWEPVYGVQYENENSEVVSYKSLNSVKIQYNKGIRIGNYRSKILSKEIGEEGETYDYIPYSTYQEYQLSVINTVGNNRFLCKPYIKTSLYSDKEINDITLDILSSIDGRDFVLVKRDNTFGVEDLYFDTWASMAYYNSGGTSSYELSNILNNISVIKKSSHFTLPISLQKNVTNKMEYEDLVMSQYNPEEVDKAINKLVDMEKDMYSPVLTSFQDNESPRPIDEITFNLHFRTRDLDNWQIIQDEGEYGDEGSSPYSDWLESIIFDKGTINLNNGIQSYTSSNRDSEIISNSDYLVAPFKITATENFKFYIYKYKAEYGEGGWLEYNYDCPIGPVQEIEIYDTSYFYKVGIRHIKDNEKLKADGLNVAGNALLLILSGQTCGPSCSACTIKKLDGSGIPLTADYQYCNYFITDYYPYYNYVRNYYEDIRIQFSGGTLDKNNGKPITSATPSAYSTEYLIPPIRIKMDVNLGNNTKFYLYRYYFDKYVSDFRFDKRLEDAFDPNEGIELHSGKYVYKLVVSNFSISGTENLNGYLHFSSPVSEKFLTNNFGKLVQTSDLLGFLWFTTDDVLTKRDKLRKSFLRLTFFDSKDPEKQNMLGTSTLYFDYDRYFDTLDEEFERLNRSGMTFHYELAAKSRQPDRSGGDSGKDVIPVDINTKPTVLTECFKVDDTVYGKTTKLANLMPLEKNLKLSSYIKTTDFSQKDNYSEGFYAYILKAFADKNEEKTAYMKVEFFHAGVGVKVPLVLPTIENFKNTSIKYTDDFSSVTENTISIIKDDGVLSFSGYNASIVTTQEEPHEPTVISFSGDSRLEVSVKNGYLIEEITMVCETFLDACYWYDVNGNNLRTIENYSYWSGSKQNVVLVCNVPSDITHTKSLVFELRIKYKKAGEYSAISLGGWDKETYDEFIKGYSLDTVFDRLYIPIKVSYSKPLRKFIYSIDDNFNYCNAVTLHDDIVFDIGSIDSNGNNKTSYTTSTEITKYMRSDFLEAPIRVSSIESSCQFTVYIYNSKGQYLHNNNSETYNDVSLTNRDYLYRIVCEMDNGEPFFTNDHPTIEERAEQSKNYQIKSLNWTLNLFELKIKPQ